MKYFKKYDLWLILAVLGISALLLLVRRMTVEDGAQVIVYLNNEKYGEYFLADDAVIEVRDEDTVINEVCIANGYAYMKWADCPDGLCLSQQKICMAGESICCLPNKVYIEVISLEHAEYDAITQ